jgi:carboxypeptidase D
MLQENGLFLWQEGTHRPTQNPCSWTNLTMVYVDQPAGVGFSLEPSTAKNEEDVANEFKDFFGGFVNEDTQYFNVKGIQINDPLINTDDIFIESMLILSTN